MKTPTRVYAGQAKMGRLASAIIILMGLIVGLRVAIPYFQRGRITTNTVNPQGTPLPRSTGFSLWQGSNTASTTTGGTTTAGTTTGGTTTGGATTTNPTLMQPANPVNPGGATTLPANPYPPDSSGPPGGVTGGW